jgi:hypothetical protein
MAREAESGFFGAPLVPFGFAQGSAGLLRMTVVKISWDAGIGKARLTGRAGTLASRPKSTVLTG